MSDFLFRIRNFKAAYSNDIALHIPKLDIPRGKLIFVLGNSGCGKTTLLETLGLMSKYWNDDAQILFYPDSLSETINYQKVWEDEGTVSAIRRNYFCFMFQDTNLFSQFSVLENIALTQIIYNIDKTEAIAKAQKEMRNLGIENLIDNNINEMSGGERQRVAFARSLLAKGNVFFADEPTGNLGEDDAYTVLRDIKNDINSNKTAIVVSHDIDMAIEYADIIIIIQDNHIIGTKSIFENPQKEQREHIKDVLNSKEKNNDDNNDNIPTSSGENKKNPINLTYNDKKFKDFFSNKSTEDLSLKKKSNWLLVVILWIALWAIGFSNGAMNVLEEKMRDPFINWISLEIPRMSIDKIPELLNVFLKADEKKKFSINEVNGYYKYLLSLKNNNSGGTSIAIGRTLSISDPILSELKKDQNLLRGDLFISDADIGLVLSEHFLDQFGYDETDNFIYMSMVVNQKDIWVPVPIRGVVKNLPDKSLFISTPYFYQKRNRDSSVPFSPSHTNEIILFCEGNKENANAFVKSLSKFVSSNDSLKKKYDPYVYIDEAPDYHKPWIKGEVVKVSFLNTLSLESINEITDSFLKSVKSSEGKISQIYKYPNSASKEYKDFNRVSIHVNDLNYVDGLSKMLMNNYELEIDMETVESLNNYNFVAKLTFALSVIIIAISLTSVCIFVIYILYLHLYKNRKYIGLLKAFGVIPASLRTIYINKLFISIVIASVVSIILASLTGYLFSFHFFRSIRYPFDYFSLLFILLLFITSLTSLFFTAGFILKNSPGDLIYDRINKKKE